MKLLALLAAVLLIGVLLFKQSVQKSIDVEQARQPLSVPEVPRTPEQLKAFESEINDFVKEHEQEAARKMREAEGN